MIYACLRFLAEWHTPLTPLNYTLLGGASGFTLAAGAGGAGSQPQLVGFLAGWAIVLTVLAARRPHRLAVAQRAAASRARRMQSAIGVKHPIVVQRSMGFMGGSFNTREFFHGAQPGALARGQAGLHRARLRACRWCCWSLGAAAASAPLLLAAFGGAVRRAAGRALVLLRAGAASAEPVLPGGQLKP